MKGNSSTREESENARSIYNAGNSGISAMRAVLNTWQDETCDGSAHLCAYHRHRGMQPLHIDRVDA
jgi:hypothetical protein